MNTVRDNRIELLTQAFSRMPKSLNKETESIQHMLVVRRAGFSEFRIFSAVFTKAEGEPWITASQREAKTRLRYSVEGDEAFYTDVLKRVNTALTRMKLDKTHTALCDAFMSDFTKQLTQLTGLTLIKPTGVIL